MSEHQCDSRDVEDRDEGSGDFHSIRRYWSCSKCGVVQSNQHITQWIDSNIAGVNKDNYPGRG
jgi:hypothetical protein